MVLCHIPGHHDHDYRDCPDLTTGRERAGTNPLSNAAYHAAGLANPRSTHRGKQSPGCGCYWCSPFPCNLCGLSHTNPSVTDGCLAHATAREQR